MFCDEHDHKYEDGTEVVLWMNTVGPYHNRQETYSYFSLPLCTGPKESIEHYHESLAEALQGVELEFSGLDIRFKENVDKTAYCKVTMNNAKYEQLAYAITNQYWYQMYVDDLPIWGILGEVGDDGTLYIWTHKRLDFGFNSDNIVDVNLTSEGRVKLEQNGDLSFSYEVHWRDSPIEFYNRFDKYLDPGFFQHRIHWFSIFNSFMMVIFLVGLVTMILMRTLRKDLARYSGKDEEVDELEKDLGDEYGWKQVHGDVFRAPPYPALFSSLIGTGAHIAAVVLAAIFLASFGRLYAERSSMLSTIIFVYAATSPVNGFFGAASFSRFGGKRWIRQMVQGAFLLPGLVCSTAFLVNFIAIYYHASRAIPFLSMIAVAAIVLFVIFPLNLVGVVFGRNLAGKANYPCRINAVPRPIPEKKWFMEPMSIIFLGGILPFGSIFIEMYFIFTSFWAYKIYYVYGFMLLVFIILCIVTVCVTIVSTYFLLNAEDYRWQWTSFLAGTSTSGYVYLYSIYYFLFKTK